jgi:hypothetical protein
MSRNSKSKRPPQSEPNPEHPEEEGNGAPAPLTAVQEQPEQAEPLEEQGEEQAEEQLGDEPAQVNVTMKGSDRAVRAAAKRFGGDTGQQSTTRRPATPAPETEPEPEGPTIDPIAVLLADGKNMVMVTRQKPRTVTGPDGREVPTNIRIPGRFTCPTTKSEIEEQIFEREGGSKYKCTIHPDTTDGETKILGHFTIEHPDPKCPPYVDGVTVNLPEPEPDERVDFTKIPTGSGDPTMRETDSLFKLKQDAERRIERARLRKEALQMEREAKRMEAELERDLEDKPASAPVQSSDGDEIKKLREQLAEKDRLLSEKKVNDRFDKIEGTLASIATALTTKPAAVEGESFAMQMLKQSQQHSKDMMDLMRNQTKPAPPADNLDAMLERFAKMKGVFGKDDSRVSDFQNKIMEMAMDRFMDGGGNGGEREADEDTDDVLKLGLKQLTPILKTYVEKTLDKETKGGAEPSPERVKQIYAEAAQKAAQQLALQMQRDGLMIATTADGRPVALPGPKKAAVPPRHVPPKVLSERATAEGFVKTIQIQPENLQKKQAPRPAGPSPAHAAPSAIQEEEEVVKYAEFPGLGAGNGNLKVEIPPAPGDMKYDRKRSVNFILDAIRSEIKQEIPRSPKNESFVPSDALDLLDTEILDRMSVVDSGEQLETLLSEFGDKAKIDEIKAAGQDEVVKSWLRRIFNTISEVHVQQKTKK